MIQPKSAVFKIADSLLNLKDVFDKNLEHLDGFS